MTSPYRLPGSHTEWWRDYVYFDSRHNDEVESGTWTREELFGRQPQRVVLLSPEQWRPVAARMNLGGRGGVAPLTSGQVVVRVTELRDREPPVVRLMPDEERAVEPFDEIVRLKASDKAAEVVLLTGRQFAIYARLMRDFIEPWHSQNGACRDTSGCAVVRIPY